LLLNYVFCDRKGKRRRRSKRGRIYSDLDYYNEYDSEERSKKKRKPSNVDDGEARRTRFEEEDRGKRRVYEDKGRGKRSIHEDVDRRGRKSAYEDEDKRRMYADEENRSSRVAEDRRRNSFDRDQRESKRRSRRLEAPPSPPELLTGENNISTIISKLTHKGLSIKDVCSQGERGFLQCGHSTDRVVFRCELPHF